MASSAMEPLCSPTTSLPHDTQHLSEEAVITPERLISLQKRAIELLSLSSNVYLGCRDDESATLSDIIECGIRDKVGRAIFVFGVCGTGKTTTVNHVVSECLKGRSDINSVTISGSSYVSAWQVIQSIYDLVVKRRARRSDVVPNTSKSKLLNYRDVCSSLATAFSQAPRYTICVMDEVDYLQTFVFNSVTGKHSNGMLQALLSASHARGSRVLFIAISNNLRLATLITEKQCQFLLFKPYTERQIISIIKGKLASLEVPYTRIIKDTSILLLARRVANTSGDLRACLDTFTRALANSMSDLEMQRDDMVPTSYENTPERSMEDCETPKRGYIDAVVNSLESFQVDHRDVGSLTPTLSLTKSALLETRVKSLPLMQLLTLLAIAKSARDDDNIVVSLQSIKVSLLHLADMLSMEKTDVENFCLSQFSEAIDIFKELGIISKSGACGNDDNLVSLLYDHNTLSSVVLPISPAFVGLDLEFTMDEIGIQKYSKIANS
uniref:ATPase AAA-type core domain-containing protein n=1 Tax=Babesia bovis TaxID=5865 RepID=S6C808_BABBO|nr:conserved hypothetical protein [Babesia bovis]